jgi:hypothetical protein
MERTLFCMLLLETLPMTFFLCCFSLSGVRIALYRFPCLSAMLHIDQTARKKNKEKRSSSSTTIHIIIHSIGVMNNNQRTKRRHWRVILKTAETKIQRQLKSQIHVIMKPRRDRPCYYMNNYGTPE